jgi:hypothetical protein
LVSLGGAVYAGDAQPAAGITKGCNIVERRQRLPQDLQHGHRATGEDASQSAKMIVGAGASSRSGGRRCRWVGPGCRPRCWPRCSFCTVRSHHPQLLPAHPELHTPALFCSTALHSRRLVGGSRLVSTEAWLQRVCRQCVPPAERQPDSWSLGIHSPLPCASLPGSLFLQQHAREDHVRRRPTH